MNLPNFKVRIINKGGIQDVDVDLKSNNFEIRSESMDI